MITQRIEQKIFRDFAQKRINHVQPVSYTAAKGLVAQVYDQMLRDFQLVPPVTVHSPSPKLLAGVWGIVRESLVTGPVSKADREAVAAAVSTINECPFCVDVHTTMLHGGSEHDVADAILAGHTDRLPESKIRSIVQWSLATRSPNAEILSSPPFSRKEAPEIIGTAITFHYINRMVNVFLDDSPLPIPSVLSGLKGVMSRMAGSMIGKRILSLSPRPGESLTFLPAAELPDDLSWAESNPAVAGAFARFAAVVDEAGKETLVEQVRALVRSHVDSWNGEDPGLSRRWVEDAVAELDDEHKSAGRLALLTALASYQVDAEAIEAFRAAHSGDDKLVGAVAWASFTAARRVGTWLHVPNS